MLKIIVTKKRDVAGFCFNGDIVETLFDRNEVLTGVPSAGGGVGGFCGTSDGGDFVDCYAWGSVEAHVTLFASNWFNEEEPLTYHSAVSIAGGFVGISMSSTITNCYSIGSALLYDTGDIEYYASRLDGTPVLSGFASVECAQSAVVTDSYWDVTASGSADSTLATGQSTIWMQTQENYEVAGWDFDTVWEILPTITPSTDVLPYDDYYYDAEAGTYKDRWGSDLTWDGTWGSIWTANPVWCTRDMIKHNRYGLGKYIRQEYLDDDLCIELAKYCDEMVKSGITGTDSDVCDKRFRMDLVIDSAGRAADVMQMMTNLYRGFQFYSLGSIDLGIDRPQESTQMFGMGNIVKGSYSGGWLSWKESINDVRIRYLDRSHKFEQDMVGYSKRSVGDKYRPKEYHLYGVVRRSQAMREAMYLYNVSNIISRTISFRAGIDAIVAKAGQVIEFSHDVPQWGFSGRVVRSSASDVLIDQAVTLTGGETYFIRVQYPNDAMETVQISDAAADRTTSDLPILTSFSSDVSAFDKYSLGTSTSISKPFRIMKIIKEGGYEADIVGIEYNSDVYDQEAFKKPGSYYSVLNLSEMQVSSLVLHERLIVASDGTIQSALDIYWEAPSTRNVVYRSYSGAKIYSKTADNPDTWILEGFAYGTRFTLHKDADSVTEYEIKVVAVTNDGYEANLYSAPTATITLYGKTAPPEDVTNFDVTQYGDKLYFTWTPVSDVDVSFYRITRGSIYESGTTIAETDSTVLELSATDAVGSQTFWIVAVDTSGNISANPTMDTLGVAPVDGAASLSSFDIWSTGLEGSFTSDFSFEYSNVYDRTYNRKIMSLGTIDSWESLEAKNKSWEEAFSDSDLMLDSNFVTSPQSWTMLDPVVLPAIYSFVIVPEVTYKSNSTGTVSIYVSTSLNGVVWEDFSLLTTSIYTAKYLRYRVVIQNTSGVNDVKVSSILLHHASLNRTTARGQDVLIDIAGNTEEFGITFAEPPQIIATIVNGVSGAVIVDSKTVSDFVVHVENFSGSNIGTAEIDWIAEGYIE